MRELVMAPAGSAQRRRKGGAILRIGGSVSRRMPMARPVGIHCSPVEETRAGGPSSKSRELSEAGEKCGKEQIGKSLNAVSLHLLLLLPLLLSTLYYNTTVHSYNYIHIYVFTTNGHAARGIRWHVDHSDPSEPITPATAPYNPVALPCKGAPSRTSLDKHHERPGLNLSLKSGLPLASCTASSNSPC